MKQFFHLFLITFLPFLVFSQTIEEKQLITKDYNKTKLEKLSSSFLLKAEHEKTRALELAKQNGWPIRFEEDGKLSELMKVSKEGTPVYYSTYNINAAKSSRANTLHNGGILGLNLEGQNMEAHVWDAGLARTTHQEYDGVGGSNRFSIGDGTTALHYHSAHVTGTIMASGYSSNAKGMAPQADAIGYDWSSDVSEATTAAGNGMLLSNHSYGWNIIYVLDWEFGAYVSDSRDWDVAMYNAPYYLMVVAAGNEGNDNSSNGNPLDGNSSYDKLSSHATTKNNLVVANAYDATIDANGDLISVNINTGSSEGPTDDYRVKPDITGNGSGLYSSYESSDSDYGSISGTSMASPNVCGTLLLLQQYYNNLNSGFMRAATLKGLALHTADDAGPSGPDAVWGWGLINGKDAANVISNDGSESLISELTLNQGGSYSINVDSDGVNDLIASISWTDPPGTANTGTANDNTPVLVNDLDIRVTKVGSTYYPYRLTSITTNGTGDNIVDPFEKVIVGGASGTYTITVTHKGSLYSGSQNFSLIVTGKSGEPMAPVANFEADDLSPVNGQTISFTDLSTNIPTSWEWAFDPATVTYVGGSSSTHQNPQVTFDVNGTYSVTLAVSNALGGDIEVKTDYLNVVDCSYCPSTFSDLDDDYISNVTFNTIDNTSGGTTIPNSYEDFTSISTDLSIGSTYPISVTITMNGNWNQNAFAFIDWNHDCDFNDADEAFDLGVITGTGTIYSNITVPPGVLLGSTRMRIVEEYLVDPEPCDPHDGNYGATEDYTVNVLGGHVTLDLKAYLEGPFNGTDMDADITSYLPLSQPFNMPIWNYSGTETLGSIPNANVVAWVLVDVRDAATAATATSVTSVAKQAAFILSDGSIVDLDGSSNLQMSVSISQNMYVAIWHRNHLGIISNNSISGSGGTYTYDFTTGINQVYGTTTGHKQLAPGIWGMYGGDGNHNGQVELTDKSNAWESAAGEKGYLFGDYNLDGEANNQDKDDVWEPNEGRLSQVPN